MFFSLLFFQPFCFQRDQDGNALTLLFCVTPAIALYFEYIKIRVENFDLIMESSVSQIFGLIFATVIDNCLPTYLGNNINAILKSPSNLFMGS